MSVANVRDTPYLTSAHVTAAPSSNVTPSLIVNSQVWLLFDARPVSVAMSGTIEVPLAGSGRFETCTR